MKSCKIYCIALALATFFSMSLAQSDKGKTTGAKAESSHVMVTPGGVKWGAAPPSLPAGAQAAILEGDPSKAGAPFIIRLKVPNGYKVPPHWHPTDEHVTVLKGTFMIGIGEKLDPSAGHPMPAGSYAKMPKEVRHYAWAKGETVIQVHGIGPFEITYVNPADDPRQKSASK